MITGLTDVQTITGSVVGLFVLLAIVTVIRIVLRRDEHWRRIRLGVFLERDPGEDEEE